MIGQRSAVMGRAAAPARARPVATSMGKTRVMPVVAGRHFLIERLQRSVLVQLMLAMALVSFAALIYLNQASKVSILQFNIAALQTEQIQLNIQNANLYATGTSLQSLQRIETVATIQLRMTKPDYSNIVWIAPRFPRVTTLTTAASLISARQSSQPLAWMQHTVQFIGSQL